MLRGNSASPRGQIEGVRGAFHGKKEENQDNERKEHLNMKLERPFLDIQSAYRKGAPCVGGNVTPHNVKIIP